MSNGSVDPREVGDVADFGRVDAPVAHIGSGTPPALSVSIAPVGGREIRVFQ